MMRIKKSKRRDDVVPKRIRDFLPFYIGFSMLTLVFSYGLYIYSYIEGWSLLDSFYQVVITLSTVGFKEVHPLSQKGRFHTSLLIIFGVGSYAYLLGSFTEAFIEGRIQMFWGRKKMEKKIARLKDHYIICGYGRIGSIVARELLRENCKIVIVDKNPDVINELKEKGYFYVEGDATSDETLLQAGLKRAKAVITTLTSDAQNIYVTLSVKQLSPSTEVIARAEDESSIPKLKYAGADRVLTPYLIGGLRMAQLVLRPTVINFLEMAIHGNDMGLQMEELKVSPSSELIDKDLIESQIRPKYNLIIIAIKKKDGRIVYNPTPKEKICAEDTLIVVGKKTDLERIRKIL